MRTEICDRLGIEYPIFAFSHCRDVVAAVSNAGGMGVLGAVFFTVDELTENLNWIDRHVRDKPYGVDVLIPARYTGKGEGLSAEELENKLRDMIPEEHRDFAKAIMKDAGVPELPENHKVMELIGLTEETAKPLIDVSLTHEKVRLIVNALGTPPAHIVEEIQDSGRMVAALCGSVKHALNHKAAGIDIVICTGTEAGGHRGTFLGAEPTTQPGLFALLPQVVAAVSVPVIAAGSIANGKTIAAALILGASAAQIGTAYLRCPEASVHPLHREALARASDDGTRLTRLISGKPARALRTRLVEELQDMEGQTAPYPSQVSLQRPLASGPDAKPEEVMTMWSGQSAALSRELPAADLTNLMIEETDAAFSRFSGA